MTRNEQLAFCSKCTNRKMDFEKGLLCRLTNQYAAFGSYCSSFDIDQKEFKIQIENAKEDLDLKAGSNTRSSLSKLFQENPHNIKSLFRISKRKSRWKIVLGCVSIAIGIIDLIRATKSGESPSWIHLLFFGLGSSLIYSVRKSLRDREAKITLADEGLIHQNSIHRWSQIIEGEIVGYNSSGFVNYWLHLYLYPSNFIRINIDDLDANPADIGVSIEYYRQVFWSKNLDQ